MSRSYRKNFGEGLGKERRMKRLANKKVRKTKGVSNGKQFKKLFQSYDIEDYHYIAYGGRQELESMYDEREIHKKVNK